ncbi:MAG: DUF4214 domain-containing protein [Acidobacteria bacterium]|nr:DUF4214 domain-containing protein [Acidobacteriota bacterium]
MRISNSETIKAFVASSEYRERFDATPDNPPASVSTNTGTSVNVQSGSVTVTYSSVTSPGNTTITPINPASAGALPDGYALGDYSLAFDITTTATVTPPIDVCFNVPSVTDAARFDRLRVLHGEGGALIDRTSNKNFAAKTVCGRVTSLSPFVLAETSQPITPTPTPTPTPATLQLSQSGYSVGEGGVFLSINVLRSGDTSQPATVSYATSDTSGLNDCSTVTGKASARCDYTTSLGKLTFAAGEQSKTVNVSIVDDSYAEGTETFTFSLSNPTNATLGTSSLATITITDNDQTTGANPLNGVDFFIRQHYLDFLGREPEPAGLQGWRNTLNNCPQGSTACDRIEVSSGFFRSEEFQTRGYFIYRFYSASLGRIPRYNECIPDFAQVMGFLSPEQLEANKVSFIADFMARGEFRNRYDALTDPTAYVDALLQTAGLQNHPSRGTWIAALTNQSMTRAQVLRALVESTEVYQKYYNEAFVVMQYFGYLRRDPDILYLNWIQTLNQNGGDYRTMINGFLNSDEYRKRFGP